VVQSIKIELTTPKLVDIENEFIQIGLKCTNVSLVYI